MPNFVPPDEVLSINSAVSAYPTHFNLNPGAAFNISCLITHTINSSTVYIYKDEVVISKGDLESTTLTETVHSATQKSIQLQFLYFLPVHDGLYYCFANTSDTYQIAVTDLYLYGSGEDSIAPVNV